jgi:hypothetical protein
MCTSQVATNSVAKPTSKHLHMKTKTLINFQPWLHLKMKSKVYLIFLVVYWPKKSTCSHCYNASIFYHFFAVPTYATHEVFPYAIYFPKLLPCFHNDFGVSHSHGRHWTKSYLRSDGMSVSQKIPFMEPEGSLPCSQAVAIGSYPGKGPPVPIVQEAGWAPEPVWTQRLEEKSFVPPGIEPRSPGRPVRSQTLYCLS